MNFSPQTEEQVSKLLKKGEGDFTVVSATDEVSKKTNSEMIKLVLEVYDANGKKATLTDYLLPAMAYKLRHFAYAVGLGARYEAGTMEASHCAGRGGRLKIGIEEGTGSYPDKNVVKDYVIADATKQGNGYQAAKAADAPAPPKLPPVTIAMNAAKREWASRNPELQREGLIASFENAVQAYNPGKPAGLWSVKEWERFVADGFFKKIEDPTQGEAIFADTDIPF